MNKQMIEFESDLLNIEYIFKDFWNTHFLTRGIPVLETVWRGFYDEYFILPNTLLNLEFQMFIHIHIYQSSYVIEFVFEEGIVFEYEEENEEK